MSRLKRVVITGIGVIAPNGNGKDEFLDAILKGVSGIRVIPFFDTSPYTTRIAGIARSFNALNYFSVPETRRMARFAQFAVVAAREAVRDANYRINPENNFSTGAFIGVSVNAMEIIEKQVKVLHESGPSRMSPFTVAGSLPNSAAVHVSVDLGIKGCSATLSTGCSSSLNAIGYAFEMIRSGRLRAAVCGGAEAPVTPSILGAFCAAGVLSNKNETPESASRPFDRQRDGYVLSEGAAILFIESLDSARSRNAKIYAEIGGFGSTMEAVSMHKMDESGKEAARAVKNALDDARIKPKEIDYVSAHGSSSMMSDIRETRALKMVFGDHARNIKVSSVKSMIGHPLGLAGGIQAAATILAASKGCIHPTMNYIYKDPECDLDYVPNEALRRKIKRAVINSFGMGGNNASVLLHLH